VRMCVCMYVRVCCACMCVTPELFLTVTRARSKSHTTPNTECVTIFYTCQFSESNPHERTFAHH